MRVLYDGALISGPDLKGASLVGSNETLKITLSPLSLENHAGVLVGAATLPFLTVLRNPRCQPRQRAQPDPASGANGGHRPRHMGALSMTALAATDGRRLTLSPIGFRLVDELTGIAPIGEDRVRARCGRGRGMARFWHPATPQPQRRGDISGLGPPPAGACGRRTAQFSRADHRGNLHSHYQSTSDGIVFTAPLWNDEEVPPDLPPMTMDVMLAPAPNMAFTTELRVLRGTVRGANGPVAFAEVSRGLVDRTLTDERGEYALPLRQPPFTGPVTIDAVERRTLLAGHITVTLPGALSAGQPIVIS